MLGQGSQDDSPSVIINRINGGKGTHEAECMCPIIIVYVCVCVPFIVCIIIYI